MNQFKDYAAGLPAGDQIVKLMGGPPKPQYVTFARNFAEYQNRLLNALNGQRINQQEYDRLKDMTGDPARNAGSFPQRFNDGVNSIAQKYTGVVHMAVGPGHARVDPDTLNFVNGIDQYLHKQGASNAQLAQKMQTKAGAMTQAEDTGSGANLTPSDTSQTDAGSSNVPATVVHVTSQAQFDALPPKTVFIDSSGKKKMKP
jgi:hypothetical protein